MRSLNLPIPKLERKKKTTEQKQNESNAKRKALKGEQTPLAWYGG